MADTFENILPSIGDPAQQLFRIIPTDDDITIDPLPQAVRFDAAGAITLRANKSPTFQTINVQAGEVIPLRVAQIRATGTDANVTIHGLV